MRLEDETLILSERNLLVLLSKLYTDGSACEIGGGEDCPMNVRVEHDALHYSGRIGPGPMHPTTEAIVRAVRDATVGQTISPLAAFFIMADLHDPSEDSEDLDIDPPDPPEEDDE